MADERRMAARDVDPMPFGAVQLGDGGDRTHADADALVVGERYDTRESAMILSRDHGNRRAKIHGDAFPGCEITTGRYRKPAVQIVMTLKQLPRIHFAAMDFQLDRRSPKTPPLQLAGGHVEDPIGLEPGGDVVVARHGDEAAWYVAAADAFCNRGGTYFGDVAINDAGRD